MTKIQKIIDSNIDCWNCSQCKYVDECDDYSPEDCIIVKKITSELKQAILEALPKEKKVILLDSSEMEMNDWIDIGEVNCLQSCKQSIEKLFEGEKE